MTHSVPCLLAVSSCALDRISLGNSAVDQTYHFCRISLLSAVSTHCFGVLFGRKVSIEWMGHINKRPYIIANEVRFHCGSIFLRRCQRCCSGTVSAVQRKSEKKCNLRSMRLRTWSAKYFQTMIRLWAGRIVRLKFVSRWKIQKWSLEISVQPIVPDDTGSSQGCCISFSSLVVLPKSVTFNATSDKSVQTCITVSLILLRKLFWSKWFMSQ